MQPDILLEDGAKPEVPGWDLSAIWTPGHSPGHLCFWEPRYQLMLSGDHVLPRITPNIPFHPQAGDDPLGDFHASLDKLEHYEADEVLPAHEHRFVGLQGRLEELRVHHQHRFEEIVVAIGNGVTTAWGIAEHMHWSRSWDRIEGFMRRAAVAEAMAHLRTLERRGILHETIGEPSKWDFVRKGDDHEPHDARTIMTTNTITITTRRTSITIMDPKDITMNDEEILKRIRTMVDEEHGLRQAGETVDNRRRTRDRRDTRPVLGSVRQRHPLAPSSEAETRDEHAQVHDVATVERYEQ